MTLRRSSPTNIFVFNNCKEKDYETSDPTANQKAAFARSHAHIVTSSVWKKVYGIPITHFSAYILWISIFGYWLKISILGPVILNIFNYSNLWDNYISIFFQLFFPSWDSIQGPFGYERATLPLSNKGLYSDTQKFWIHGIL